MGSFLGFALRISDLPQVPQGSLHHEILQDNVQHALARPSSPTGCPGCQACPRPAGHWACRRLLLMMVQLSSTNPVCVAMLLANFMGPGRPCMLSPESLRIQTGSAPSKGGKCAPHHRWSMRIARIGPDPRPEPYSQLPSSDRCKRHFQFRLGAHTLPICIKMGRRLRMARVAQARPIPLAPCLCMHTGDERCNV